MFNSMSSILYTKNYLKRISRRLLEITGDENPGDNMTEDKQKSEVKSLFYVVYLQ
jgi:hypothetical protein